MLQRQLRYSSSWAVYVTDPPATLACNAGHAGRGQHSRHIDRKFSKMRELNHQGKVHVIHVSTNDNWADIFTKSLDSLTFARHRDTILNVKAIPKEKVDEGKSEGSWS